MQKKIGFISDKARTVLKKIWCFRETIVVIKDAAPAIYGKCLADRHRLGVDIYSISLKFENHYSRVSRCPQERGHLDEVISGRLLVMPHEINLRILKQINFGLQTIHNFEDENMLEALAWS